MYFFSSKNNYHIRKTKKTHLLSRVQKNTTLTRDSMSLTHLYLHFKLECFMREELPVKASSLNKIDNQQQLAVTSIR